MADYKFTGDEGEFISRAEAKQMRNKYENSSAFEANKEFKAVFFGKEKLLTLLNDEQAFGIRIYYGINEADEPNMVLYKVSEDGENIGNQALELGLPCPRWCPKGEE